MVIAELVAFFGSGKDKFDFLGVWGPKPGGAAGNSIAPRAKNPPAQTPKRIRRVRWGAERVEMLLILYSRKFRMKAKPARWKAKW